MRSINRFGQKFADHFEGDSVLRFGASSIAQSSRCEAADNMTSWVSVSFIGILRLVADGVSRRHHRSPALASKPARRDPETRRCRLVEQSHTTARSRHECQSILDNLIAGFSQNLEASVRWHGMVVPEARE